MTKQDELSFVEDLIICCTSKTIPSEQAQKAVRALCRYFGGQILYIPENDNAGENILGVITDATNDSIAPKIFERIKNVYGGMQKYIPMERNAFRKIIALEIYKKHGSNGITMNDLARQYGISFSQAYRLWREGQRNRAAQDIPYLPFLELLQ